MDNPLKPKKRKSEILDERDLDNVEIIDPTVPDYEEPFPEYRKSQKEKARYSPYKSGGGKRAVKK